MCSQCQIRKFWISLSVHLVYRTEAHAKHTWGNLKSSLTAEIVWTVSARLLGAKRFFSIKRGLDSAYIIYEVLAARHPIFLKCSLLARHIWPLLVLAKINALLAYSQVLATETIRYPYIRVHLSFYPAFLRYAFRGISPARNVARAVTLNCRYCVCVLWYSVTVKCKCSIRKMWSVCTKIALVGKKYIFR